MPEVGASTRSTHRRRITGWVHTCRSYLASGCLAITRRRIFYSYFYQCRRCPLPEPLLPDKLGRESSENLRGHRWQAGNCRCPISEYRFDSRIHGGMHIARHTLFCRDDEHVEFWRCPYTRKCRDLELAFTHLSQCAFLEAPGAFARQHRCHAGGDGGASKFVAITDSVRKPNYRCILGSCGKNGRARDEQRHSDDQGRVQPDRLEWHAGGSCFHAGAFRQFPTVQLCSNLAQPSFCPAGAVEDASLPGAAHQRETEGCTLPAIGSRCSRVPKCWSPEPNSVFPSERLRPTGGLRRRSNIDVLGAALVDIALQLAC
mmetsp:Transcript_74925/g.195136  ORF Transcript_74925/g.195136 Transcript_74925/m.195136 type:complete len:316 (-) Transcript_74925:66-1013(-)